MKQEIVTIDDEDLKNNENFCCVCLIGVIIVITKTEWLYIILLTLLEYDCTVHGTVSYKEVI